MKSYEENKSVWKRHAISGALTFAVGVAMALLADIDNITLETVKNGSAFGILFVALRNGLKALLEWLITFKE